MVRDDIDTTDQGEEVFKQDRSLSLKSVNVRRLYDEDRGIIVYVSYSTRFNKDDDESKSRYKTTMCAIKVDGQAPAPVVRGDDNRSKAE